MRPHPKIRKTTKWGGAVGAVLLLALWGASELRWFNLQTKRWTVHCSRGSVIAVRHGQASYRTPPGWYVGNHEDTAPPRTWWYEHWSASGGTSPYRVSGCRFAIWMPASVALMSFGVGWGFDRFAGRHDRAQLCRRCKYDRTGLAPEANCPECGAVPSSN